MLTAACFRNYASRSLLLEVQLTDPHVQRTPLLPPASLQLLSKLELSGIPRRELRHDMAAQLCSGTSTFVLLALEGRPARTGLLEDAF